MTGISKTYLVLHFKRYVIDIFSKDKHICVCCCQDFLTLEEQEGAVNFKFGVLFCKAGQTSDDEMFSNSKHGKIPFMCDCSNNFLFLCRMWESFL